MNFEKETMESNCEELLKTLNPINTSNQAWYIRMRDWILYWFLSLMLGAHRYRVMVSKAFMEYSISDLLDNYKATGMPEDFAKEELVFENFIQAFRNNNQYKNINDESFVKEFKSADFYKFGLSNQYLQNYLHIFCIQYPVSDRKKQLVEWITSDENGYLHTQIRNRIVYPYLSCLFSEEGIMFNNCGEKEENFLPQRIYNTSSFTSEFFTELRKGYKTVDDLVKECISRKSESVKKSLELKRTEISERLQNKCNPETIKSYVNMFFILHFAYIYNIQTINRLIKVKKTIPVFCK